MLRPLSHIFLEDNKMQEKPATMQSAILSDETIQIENSSANLAGHGSLVLVRYRFNRPPAREMDRVVPYLLDEATGRCLYVQTLPLIGPVYSHSLSRFSRHGNQEGYFVADNGEFLLEAGSKVTVVIGELRKTHVVVSNG